MVNVSFVFAMSVIPFALKNAVENKIGITVVDHSVKRTVGYQDHATVANRKRLAVFVAHNHFAVSLYEEVYFLLSGMSMTSGLSTSPETSGTEHKIIQGMVVTDHVVVIISNYFAADIVVVI